MAIDSHAGSRIVAERAHQLIQRPCGAGLEFRAVDLEQEVAERDDVASRSLLCLQAGKINAPASRLRFV